MTRKCCVECAVILCDCGAYHGTDGVVIVEAERGPLYAFASAADDEDAQCEGCQYALCDAEVDRLSRCARCEDEDAFASAENDANANEDEDEDGMT